MKRLYFGEWFTASRVLLIGAIAAVMFFWRPWLQDDRITMAQAIVALVAIVVGVKVGFLFAKRPRVLPNLPKMGALYYGLAGAIGFVLSALWASEGGSTWPLIVWFLPAAVLESFSSSAALASKRNAS